MRASDESGEPSSKTLREYREEDGQVSVPSTSTPQGGLYADQVSMPASKKKEGNLSPEMKKRLQQEYLGLGGSANQGSGSGTRQFTVMAASVQDEGTPHPASTPTTSVLLPPAAAAAAGPAAGPAGSLPADAPSGSSKWTLDPNESLQSTLEHQLWTFGCVSLQCGTYGASLLAAAQQQQLQHQLGSDDASLGLALLGTLAAYVLADLGTGVYHWGVDNYGDGQTPVFGRQIAAFQGHHQRPWTIAQREPCNNLWQVFKPATVPAVLVAGASLLLPPPATSFLSSFLLLVCMSQQFHSWSHMKKSELHPAVLALQEWGVLISRRAHGAHHRQPFEGNYCIVSGLWNGVLDDSQFFRHLERFLCDKTGVEPRCWHEPQLDWVELQQPTEAPRVQ